MQHIRHVAWGGNGLQTKGIMLFGRRDRSDRKSLMRAGEIHLSGKRCGKSSMLQKAGIRVTKISLGTAEALLCLSWGVATSVTMALAADIKAGEAVYQKACKSCHGADGTANLSLAKMLKADIKDRKSPEVQSMSVADIKKAVTRAKAR